MILKIYFYILLSGCIVGMFLSADIFDEDALCVSSILTFGIIYSLGSLMEIYENRTKAL